MKTAFVVVGIIAVIVAGFFLMFMVQGPDLKQYDPLKEPRITSMNNQKMLMVETQGDPKVVAAKAFGLLFNTYYKIKGVPKGPKQPAPRGRWHGTSSTPKSEWVGLYGLPVPETAEIPQFKAEPGFKVMLNTWSYGEVAEILYVGPYDKETDTIKKLMDYIRAQGYEITGPHEEEYIKGPGMFFRGDPEGYYTIIRYQVKKVGR